MLSCDVSWYRTFVMFVGMVLFKHVNLGLDRDADDVLDGSTDG